MNFRVKRFSSVDSTNAEALRRVRDGERGPLWIVAEAQTAGRGRVGRSWSSETGNLHATLLISLAAPAVRAYQLSLVAGVAVFDAIAAAMPPRGPSGLRLKWPNDVLIEGHKAGGILIESTTASGPGGPALAAAIGIGINVAAAPPVPGRPVTALAAHGTAPAPDALLAELARAADLWRAVWAEGSGFETVKEAWLTRAHPIGERMSISTGTERIEGAFLGLDDEGALLLDADGVVRRFTFGDVSLAREPGIADRESVTGNENEGTPSA